MNTTKVNKRWCFLLLAAGAIVIGSLIPYQTVLTFRPLDENQAVIYLPVHHQDTFQIKYTHSVHLSDVFESFSIHEEGVRPVELRYEDTAIGMPANAAEGETFEVQDGQYVITKPKDAPLFPSLNLNVGQVRANHAILYNNHTYPLEDYVGQGTKISIQPEHISLWQRWKGVNMLE
ncbi:RocC [Pontibacillus halophilus JSM 076056 = DSM 19796]|uniref:RocC n=1 Tax=Pontibacillus halophilus JSM 076056 = DSM 19796 TaxID=1385510 RepID=A0A0A5GNA4_9BACI|nr:DUF1850 domain-containing protein [Pontibacillus halophilus]KGX92733.1 RocC [Pontibacillus halophilus JSM 076056 = DSM 19796]